MKQFVFKACLFSILHIALFITSANAFKFHPFYVSVTEMNYNAKTKSIEISCKLFAEDLENVLKQNNKTPVDLTNEKLQSQNNYFINDYLVKHLAININSKPVKFKFVGFEKEKESVYCYLEIVHVTAIKKLVVTNSILYDFKKEQINIMHVLVNGRRESSKVDNPQSQASFSF